MRGGTTTVTAGRRSDAWRVLRDLTTSPPKPRPGHRGLKGWRPARWRTCDNFKLGGLGARIRRQPHHRGGGKGPDDGPAQSGAGREAAEGRRVLGTQRAERARLAWGGAVRDTAQTTAVGACGNLSAISIARVLFCAVRKHGGRLIANSSGFLVTRHRNTGCHTKRRLHHCSVRKG